MDFNNINFIICVIFCFYKSKDMIVSLIKEKFKNDETIVEYIGMPSRIANEEIKLQVLFQNLNGIKEIKYDKDKLIVNGKNKVAIDYKIIKNGIYKFEIEDINGEKKEEIEINNFDRLLPQEFNIQAVLDNTTVKIIANINDAPADEENFSSGIDYCEYWITNESGESKKYDTNEFELESRYYGKCKIYVVAVDKAGNIRQSENIENIFLKNKIISDNEFGKRIMKTDKWQDISKALVYDNNTKIGEIAGREYYKANDSIALAGSMDCINANYFLVGKTKDSVRGYSSYNTSYITEEKDIYEFEYDNETYYCALIPYGFDRDYTGAIPTNGVYIGQITNNSSSREIAVTGAMRLLDVYYDKTPINNTQYPLISYNGIIEPQKYSSDALGKNAFDTGENKDSTEEDWISGVRKIYMIFQL